MDLVYYQFNPRTTTNGPLRDACYKLFHDIWLQTLNELEGKNVIESDAFLYADKACVLMDKQQPVALHIHNRHELSNPIVFNLKSMNHYPKDLWDWFKNENMHEIYLLEYLCVHPNYRKNNGALLSYLLCYLSMKTFKHSGACAAIGVTHDLRKVCDIATSLGMKKIVKGKKVLHNVPVSYFGFHKDWDLLIPSKEVGELGDRLFKERILDSDKAYNEHRPRVAA